MVIDVLKSNTEFRQVSLLAHASTICYNYFSCFEYAEKYHSVAFQSIIIEKQHVMVLYAKTHTWGESGTIDR